MKVTLYTTHCSNCKILESMLKKANVKYSQCEDITEMARLGIKSVPVLSVNDKLLQFSEAIKFVKTQISN